MQNIIFRYFALVVIIIDYFKEFEPYDSFSS